MPTPINKHQPPALPVLFLTEMWERFGFYIIQGMLVLYLTDNLNWSDDKSYAVAGAFTGFVYISPIIGGYIADKIIGFKSAILTGGILLIAGYLLLAFSAEKNEALYLSLSIIIIGNGFFKPNIGSLLGTFYHKNDSRREAGFTWFYMGINLGSMLATLSSGFVKNAFGWSAGFGMASIGLLLGITNFLLGAKHLKNHGLPPEKSSTHSKFLTFLHTKTATTIAIILLIPLLIILLHQEGAADILLGTVAVILIIGLIILALKQSTPHLRRKMLALISLTTVSMIFWAIYFQMFFSLNLFIERNIDRIFLGYEIPTTAFISFEAIFIVLLSPLLAYVWTYLSNIHKNPSIPVKFFFSFLCMSVAFFILTLSTHFHDATGLINPFWVPVAYLLITIGELLISPIGLSAVTTLSAPKVVGMMMGVWLIAIGYGAKLAGIFAKLSSIPESITNKILQSQHYGHAFFQYAMMSLIGAVIMLIFTPWLKRLINN